MEIKFCLNCEKIYIEEKKCSICQESLTLKDENFFIGKEFGKYKIEEFIGEGGMGAVFKGIHTTLKKPVAIKILIPSKLEPSFLKRFKKEAEFMALLKHPNIVEIYDYDLSEYGFPYIVMEYLEGNSLRLEISKYAGGLPIDKFINYKKQIAFGLYYAHKKGIVHRDLKPENIFICFYENEEIVKILDFGIAKAINLSEKSMTLTNTDTIIGTPYYLSPEQLLGKEVSPLSDQYTFALICYEMLTGKPLREGKTLGEIISTVSLNKPEIAKIEFENIKKDIADALKRATHRDPKKRFESVSEFEKNLVPKVEDIGEKTTTVLRLKGEEKKNYKYFYYLPLLILLIFLLFFSLKNLKFKREKPFEIVEILDAPQDLDSFLTYKENKCFFKGINSIYLYEDFRKSPVKINLSEDEKIISGLPEGKILILKGGKVILRDYLPYNKREVENYQVLNKIDEKLAFKFSPNLNYITFPLGDKLVLYELIKGNLKEIFSVNLKEKKLKGYNLSNNFMAYILNDDLFIYDIKKGGVILETKIDSSSYYIMEFFDLAKYFAIGGWFDFVYVFDLKEKGKKYFLNFGGKTRDIKFIESFPNLLISKGGKIILWDFLKDDLKKIEEEGKEFKFSHLISQGIIALEERNSKFYLISHREFNFLKKYALSKVEIWSMDYALDLNKLFLGDSNGYLYSIDIKKHKVRSFKTNTQGITSMLCVGNNLVTASDDKTITVWEIPEMKINYKTEAHNYLINYICFSERTSNLWSSSSDGYLKVFSFPGLKIIDSLKTGNYSNASLWISEDERYLAVGTWSNSFLFFEKDGREWKILKEFKVSSLGIYSISFIPSEDFLFLSGLEPFNLYLFSIRDKKLFDLDFKEKEIVWAIPFEKNSLFAGGSNNINLISFNRQSMSGNISTLINTNLNFPAILSYLKDKNILAVGNGKGELIFIDLNKTIFPKGINFKIEKEI